MPDMTAKYLNKTGLQTYNDATPHSPAQMQAYVDTWLSEHPEVTTTVEDGSITNVKLAQENGILSQVNDLIVDHYDVLWPYFYKADTYIADGNVDTALVGYDTYKIPVKQNDLVVLHWSDAFYHQLNKSKALTVELADGTIVRNAIDTTNVSWYRFSSTIKQGISRMPENAKYFVITVYRERLDTITSFVINTPNMVLNDSTVVRKLQTLTEIDDSCAATNRFFFSDASSGVSVVSEGYQTLLMPINAGDKIKFNGYDQAYQYYGTFTSFATGITTRITTDNYTATDNGILCDFPYADGSPNAAIIVANSIKIDASNIVNDTEEPSFNGIEWVSFGDSITAQNRWQPYIVNALGMNHTNCGIGSTPLSGSDPNAFWQAVRLDAVKAANPDIITILGGANDLVVNPVIGTNYNLADKDTSTFIGAYSYIINNLLTWKPSLRIFILSTTWAHNNGADYSQTVTYEQFADACKLVANYYKLPFVDLYNNSGFNAYTMGDAPNNIYSNDHIHPNNAGGKIIANQVIAKIKEVMNFH